jgi:hypothetical protein
MTDENPHILSLKGGRPATPDHLKKHPITLRLRPTVIAKLHEIPGWRTRLEALIVAMID